MLNVLEINSLEFMQWNKKIVVSVDQATLLQKVYPKWATELDQEIAPDLGEV